MKQEVVYSPLISTDSFKATLNENEITVHSIHDQKLTATFTKADNELTLFLKDTNATDPKELSDIALEHLFGFYSDVTRIQLIQFPFADKESFRSEFYQNPALWSYKKKHTINPERWTETKGRAHPVRPRLPQGTLYRRYYPAAEKTLSFRLITMNDLDVFHNWHNQSRVAHFWELAKPKEELREYIQTGLNDPHQFPIIIEADGKPVGYFEFYWVAEDRLGPYYESEAFDRGFHFLIGEPSFLGGFNTDSAIKSVLHFFYLEDPRTRKVMAEPRHDNAKVLKYAQASIGWTKLKEFDFPHKRAALLENRREVFFGRHAL